MSGLQNFVKGNRNGQAGSHNGQLPINPHRQAVAANAKVPMKAHIARPPTAIGPHARGESVTQNQASTLQPQRRPSGEDHKRDLYDTDAESIDTTINQSVVQVENSPQVHQQLLQPDHEQFETGDSEGVSDEGSEGDESEEVYDFTDIQMQYLEQHEFLHASNAEQVRFLSQGPPYLFHTVDGDSYPTTTDGNPTEWDEQQEPRIEDLGSPSPSPQPLREQGLSTTLPSQQPPQETSAFNANIARPQNTSVWQQGAQIREQQRNDNTVQARGQSGQQHNKGYQPTSQPPPYDQAAKEPRFSATSTKHAQPSFSVQGDQRGLPQRFSRLPPGPAHVRPQIPRIEEPIHASSHASTTRARTLPFAQQCAEITSVGKTPSIINGDYDLETLSKMEYKQLTDESFDKDPRGHKPVLPEDMREASLAERLHFVQRECDSVAQAEFFSALATDEWENAGDWFLDQFSEIIKKTRRARQNKRRAAQGFEREIETRHQHVAKKQRLVEGAMAKMKAQGEGLVPKSPRRSKSPRARRE
ncbi:hypothetical protein OPT61_g1868 [Boeremia exigua]|uniref:Uncharacterized protein n=1 Tax=Boeremia exigua TaxID=749465 RepID=A0ACC2INK4_9PLEO|nr:hypothetical protein OPT61_g1868 [Boeremia exigua]